MKFEVDISSVHANRTLTKDYGGDLTYKELVKLVTFLSYKKIRKK